MARASKGAGPRTEFEAWAVATGFTVEPENPIATGGRFKWQDTSDAWEGWQAACAVIAARLEALANDADPDDFASVSLRELAAELKG